MTTLTISSSATGSGRRGDIDHVAEWRGYLNHEGAAVTTVGVRPWNHNIIGIGIGHNDAEFAERGRSFAAYLENDLDDLTAWTEAVERELRKRGA